MRCLFAPFRFDSTGRVQVTDDVTQIVEQQIINVLVTGRYERTMRPYYGAGVQALLFESADENVFADQEAEIASRINESLRMARVRGVRLRLSYGSPAQGDSTQNTLYVDVSYFIPPADQALRVVSVSFSSFMTEESGF